MELERLAKHPRKWGGGRLDSEGHGELSGVTAREEVVWVLQKLKGRRKIHGLNVELYREELVDLWWELFNWCWKCGMVPSVRKCSIVVPVPIKEEEQGSTQNK